MPDRLKPLVLFFAALAAAGLGLSMISHVAALLGKQGPLGDYAFLLHIGIFVVWFPTVFVVKRLTSDYTRKDFWRGALRGCPPWMRYMVYSLFVYAVLNFSIFLAGPPHKGGPGMMSPNMVRGFSGHWMVFYAVAMAALYSGAHVKAREEGRRCPQGHGVGPLAEFCEQCGRSVVER